MTAIGRQSKRTQALHCFHQRRWSIDRIATHLSVSQETVTGWIYPPRKPIQRKASPRRRQSVSPASPRQRQKVKGELCVYEDCEVDECAPAHLIDRSLLADREGDPLRVVPLCARHHRAYDEGPLDLLPSLENGEREELAFAVKVYGLLPTLQRVTNQRWRSE